MGSKYGPNKKQTDEANNPSKKARLGSVTDFYQKFRLAVVGYDGVTSNRDRTIF